MVRHGNKQTKTWMHTAKRIKTTKTTRISRKSRSDDVKNWTEMTFTDLLATAANRAGPTTSRTGRRWPSQTSCRRQPTEPVRRRQELDEDDLHRPPVDGRQQSRSDDVKNWTEMRSQTSCRRPPTEQLGGGRPVLPTTAKAEGLSEWVSEWVRFPEQTNKQKRKTTRSQTKEHNSHVLPQ